MGDHPLACQRARSGAVVWGKPGASRGSSRHCTWWGASESARDRPWAPVPVTQVSVAYSCCIRSTAKVTHLDSQLTNGVTRRIGRWD